MEQSTGGNMEKSHEVSSPEELKGKRTKRLRAEAKAESAGASSSSSAEPCSSATGGEEEATALCLILLAQGRSCAPPPDSSESKHTVAAAASAAAAAAASGGGRRFPGGECAYDCKTCGKSFPSFQALGGHRTSHTKNKDAPPPPPSEAKRVPAKEEDGDQRTVCNSPKPPRLHECSICRMAFSSGQALGGHMRRHRPITTASDDAALPKVKNEAIKNTFVLDLNQPAPPEDDEDSEEHRIVSPPPPPPPSTVAFPFDNQQPLVFPAPPALVDCHY